MTTLLVVTWLGFQSSGMAQLSVTVSDNVVILDEKKRSGSIDLVNLGSDPVEFTVTALDSDGTTSVAELIRWAPPRVLVNANRSARLRVISKGNIDRTVAERLVKLGITAAVQRPPRAVIQEEDTTDAVAVTVPVVPTLPLFVYVRGNNSQNTVTLDPFISTPEDNNYAGHFPISKTIVDRSFVGHVKVINKANGEILSEGRVHLPQGTEKSLVRVLRSEEKPEKQAVHCVQLWDEYPGQGEPSQTVCP